MSLANYEAYRENIKSGDLLIWSTDKTSFTSKLFYFIIRLFTLSSYAHVGVALWSEGRLFVVEADMPRVRMIPISLANDFYHIAMGIDVNQEQAVYLNNFIGKKYSLIKALKAYFRLKLEDNDEYQCVELVSKFYKYVGLENIPNVYVPSLFIESILDDDNKKLVKVNVD